MSALGGFLGGLTGGAASLGSSALSAHYQRDMLRMSDELQRKYAVDAPSLQMKGMIKAGINPMLAYGSSPSTEPLTASSVNSDIAGGISSGVNSAKAVEELELQDKQTKSTIDVNDATTKKIENDVALDTLKTLSDINLNSAKASEMSANTKNITNKGKGWDLFGRAADGVKNVTKDIPSDVIGGLATSALGATIFGKIFKGLRSAKHIHNVVNNTSKSNIYNGATRVFHNYKS